MKKYKAIIYDIDGTLLDTLKMNMYPLMKIIKEETGEDWCRAFLLGKGRQAGRKSAV